MESSSGCICAFYVIVQFLLIFLKLICAIKWAWFLVLSPTIIFVLAFVALMLYILFS